MAERDQPKRPTHRVYSVIRREGQDDFWLNLGLVFPHKDGKGFNLMLQALPIDGKLVCRIGNFLWRFAAGCALTAGNEDSQVFSQSPLRFF